MHLSYDKEADVLYIALPGHKEAKYVTCLDGDNDALIQVDPEKMAIIGYTIVGLKEGLERFLLPTKLTKAMVKKIKYPG